MRPSACPRETTLGQTDRAAAERQRSAGLLLRACDCVIDVPCPDDETAALLRLGFGALVVPAGPASPAGDLRARGDLEDRRADSRCRNALDEDISAVSTEDTGDFLFQMDKRLTVWLQHRRPDLFFLHAAAVARDGRVAVLAAPAGTGKSTLTLSLLQHGFEYLSDELAPIDLTRGTIYPYPHALCLKAQPAAVGALPAATLVTGARLHVPPESLPVRVHTEPLPLGAVFFLRRGPQTASTCRRVTKAAAVAHLMANALNAAAHPGDGLIAALMLSQSVPCYELDCSDPVASCAAIHSVCKTPLVRSVTEDATLVIAHDRHRLSSVPAPR